MENSQTWSSPAHRCGLTPSPGPAAGYSGAETVCLLPVSMLTPLRLQSVPLTALGYPGPALLHQPEAGPVGPPLCTDFGEISESQKDLFEG